MKTLHKLTGFALVTSTVLASCIALAQEPYYDPVRDVMVTPPASAPVVVGSRDARYATPYADNSFELLVRRGKLWSGPEEIVVAHGSEVTLTVDSDLPDTLRVAGYEYRVAFEADQPMLLSFKAERPGRFPIVLGRTGRQIAILNVMPPRAGG